MGLCEFRGFQGLRFTALWGWRFRGGGGGGGGSNPKLPPVYRPPILFKSRGHT